MINYRAAIEKAFNIIDTQGRTVDFGFNQVQNFYFDLLEKDYPTMEGIRENILKARKEGFSSLIDGIFVIDFLIQDKTIGGQIISHKDTETKLLMKRVHFYIDSFCEKKRITRKDLLKVDTDEYLENKFNGSFLFIGTAGAKTLGRGPTLQNIHWSECGFYPNTEILSAEKLVTGAEEQVAEGIGKIFRESTGNMQGDFWSSECERSRRGEGIFKFRFFPWFLHGENRMRIPNFSPYPAEIEMMKKYSLDMEQIAWYRIKMSKFKTKALGLREHPTTIEEAFLAGGSTYFDKDVLTSYLERVAEPMMQGEMAMDGAFI